PVCVRSAGQCRTLLRMRSTDAQSWRDCQQRLPRAPARARLKISLLPASRPASQLLGGPGPCAGGRKLSRVGQSRASEGLAGPLVSEFTTDGGRFARGRGWGSRVAQAKRTFLEFCARLLHIGRTYVFASFGCARVVSWIHAR